MHQGAQGSNRDGQVCHTGAVWQREKHPCLRPPKAPFDENASFYSDCYDYASDICDMYDLHGSIAQPEVCHKCLAVLTLINC